MQISIFATTDALQINLKPEHEHEEEFLRMLKKYDGEVTVSEGVDLALNRAGYLRNFEPSKTAAITIHKSEEL